MQSPTKPMPTDVEFSQMHTPRSESSLVHARGSSFTTTPLSALRMQPQGEMTSHAFAKQAGAEDAKAQDHSNDEDDERLDAEMASKNLHELIASPFEHTNGQRTNTIEICIGAVVGIAIGVLLTKYPVKKDTANWIALPGDLFIDAIKCLIVPLVFCSVTTSVSDLFMAGKVMSIGKRTLMYFAMASLISSTVGVIFGMLFLSLFQSELASPQKDPTPHVALQCANGFYLGQEKNGSVSCSSTSPNDPKVSQFAMKKADQMFVLTADTYKTLSISDQLIGILNDIVPENLIGAVANGSTLSMIFFALLLGMTLVKSTPQRKSEAEASEGGFRLTNTSVSRNRALLLINQCNVIFQILIKFVISLIPFSVVSLIGGSMAQYSDANKMLESVGFLIVALLLALLTDVLLIMGTALFIATRRNIFSYLRFILPAQLFIFGCSSSIATLPMTIRCVDSTREVSRSLARFGLSIGATCNLNGTAVYMPLVCIFMAKTSGMEDQLTVVRLVLLVFVGAIASYGVAPVPHSGLVMAITVWKTVFDCDVPPVFSLLIGIDWLLNRMRAVVNITNDTIIVRIIADQCDEMMYDEVERLP